jgi:hypothetical protein
MTQDVYMGRRSVDLQAAEALERALRGTTRQTENHGKSMTNDEGQDP